MPKRTRNLGFDVDSYGTIFVRNSRDRVRRARDEVYHDDAQRAAYRHFSGQNSDILKKLGIRIVEGDHPGSSYFSARLTFELKEANKIAKEMMLGIRFYEKKE